MATWPSGTKASTTNLDAGTDSPASARADIKQNTDNVNSIIDMFNIATPSNNQILKYNTTNTRFELASDVDTGITDVVQDTTPQLGGNLDVNGNSIVSASNGDISITPNGTGSVIIDGNEFPQTQGVAGQILVADGAGLLEWANQEKLTAKVINADSVTINKGEPVYVFSAQGDLISVKRALNTGDSTSAQTLGLATASIAASAEGVVICQGVLTNVDTSTYTAGQALYLGATAGSITTTKPHEPNHLVYLGFVEKVNASSGRIYVRVQNGYELTEIHDVNINNATALANNHLLRYNSASTRWENAALDIVTDTTPQLGGSLDVNGNSIVSASNGNIAITPNGTGNLVLDGLNWPQADGTADYVLKTNGSGQLSWVAQTTAFNPATPGAIGGTTASAGTFTTLTVNAANDLRLADTDSSHYVGFKAPATVTTNKIWTLPSADGTNGQVLSTNGSATLSWATAGGGGGASIALISQDVIKGTLLTGATYRQTISELSDPSGIVTVTSNQFTLGAGTYIIEFVGVNKCTTVGAVFQHGLYDVTASANIDNFAGGALNDGTNTTRWVFQWSYVVAPSSSNTYEIRTLLDATGNGVVVIGANPNFRITKLA